MIAEKGDLGVAYQEFLADFGRRPTVQELADVMDVSRRTMYRWLENAPEMEPALPGLHGRTPASLEKDEALVRAVSTYASENGYSPTIPELASELGYRTTSAVSHRLAGLRDQGRVDWVDGRPRTLRVVE